MSLQVNQLTGFGSGEQSVANITKKTVVSAVYNLNTVTQTHNGGVRTGKWIVAIEGRRSTAGSSASPNTVTLCGTSLTKVIDSAGASRQNSSIWISTTDITTDGTDDLVSDWTSDQQAGVVSTLYAVDNLQSTTATATKATTTSPSNLNVNVNAGGIIVGAAANGATTAFTWTNLTEDTDSNPGGTLQASSASAEFASAATPQTVTATHSSTECQACSASFR